MEELNNNIPLEDSNPASPFSESDDKEIAEHNKEMMDSNKEVTDSNKEITDPKQSVN
jgi:hypothetical protein